jgi:hypothetical protein
MIMKNVLSMILLGGLCSIFVGCVSTNLTAIAFKPASTIDQLSSGEVPVCGRAGGTPDYSLSEPEPEQHLQAMNILCNLEVNSSPLEIQFVA